MQIKCSLCDISQTISHDGKDDYIYESCENILTEEKATKFYLPQINLLRFKHRKSLLLKFIEEKVSALIANIMRVKYINSLAIFSLSICLVILSIVINIVPSYHKADLQIFHVWADCFDNSGHDIYSSCKYIPNYPAIGLLASAGIMHLIKKFSSLTNTEAIDNIFRSCLFVKN